MSAISVIMTVYNSTAYLPEAIVSLLGQTFTDFELIIVNDGSTDNSLGIIEKFVSQDSRIRLINNEINLKPALARNQALAIARGEYIAVLDSDDIALPHRLALQKKYLDTHPETVLVGCAAEIIDTAGKILGYRKPAIDYLRLKFELMLKNPIIHSGVMFRKAAPLELGGYNNRYLHSEDYKLYSELVKTSQITNLPDILIKYRYSPAAISIMADSRQIQLEHALEISYENINRYLNLSKEQARLFIDTIQKRNLAPTAIFAALRIYKNLIKAFSLQEKLDANQGDKLWDIYRADKKLILSNYFKNRFPKLAKIYKNEYFANKHH